MVTNGQGDHVGLFVYAHRDVHELSPKYVDSGGKSRAEMLYIEARALTDGGGWICAKNILIENNVI